LKPNGVKLPYRVFRLRFIVLAGPVFALVVVGHSPRGHAQTTDQVLSSYVGQKLILRGFGDKGKANIKIENLPEQGRGCDAAVEVMEAELKGEKLRLRLEHIGAPVIPGKETRPCSAHPGETVLSVSGIGKQEPASAVSEMLARIVQTPEVYLTTNGVVLGSQVAQISAPVVELTNSSETPPGITRPRPVLIVNAPYTDEARQHRIQGVVRVAIEVGTNGLIHSARIVKGVDPSLDRQVLRVLPLLRFEPAQKDGQVVVVRTELWMSFRLF
jgi:TonB family protein